MRRGLVMLSVVAVILASGAAATAQWTVQSSTSLPSWLRIRPVTIPDADSTTGGLDGWLVFPEEAGKHPLVLLPPVDLDVPENVSELGPGRMLPEAEWWVQRGWAAGIVLRRGYGLSGSFPKKRVLFDCGKDNLEAAEDSANVDLKIALSYFAAQPEVDGTRLISMEENSRADPNIWLTDEARPLLGTIHMGAINRGFPFTLDFPYKNGKCRKGTYLPALIRAGARTHVPGLWIFANANGKDTSAERESRDTFVNAGGSAQLEFVKQFDDKNASYVFNMNPNEWGPLVEGFLEKLGLPARAIHAAPEIPDATVPKGVPKETQEAFGKYLLRGPNKAFALGPKGFWAYRFGKMSLKIAEREALADCEETVRAAQGVISTTPPSPTPVAGQHDAAGRPIDGCLIVASEEMAVRATASP